MKIYTHKMLLKRISLATKLARQVVAKEEETILFKEISIDNDVSDNTVDNYFDAHELFNQFTADVIKRKVKFCR